MKHKSKQMFSKLQDEISLFIICFSAVVLMVVQRGEKNRADQRVLEYSIRKR